MVNPSHIKEQTYWMDPHPTTKPYSDKDLPQKTDVLVIGSGFTGVVTALKLKQAGVDVTLLDKGRIGSEAQCQKRRHGPHGFECQSVQGAKKVRPGKTGPLLPGIP